MTDANGTRNNRINAPTPGSTGSSAKALDTDKASQPVVGNPSKANDPARKPIPGIGAKRSASRELPSRTRRTRRPRKSDSTEGKLPTERRRLFGAGPDRIKSKSSSRTRALKAKAAPGNAGKSGSLTNRSRERGPKKRTGTISTIGKAAKAALAEKKRPALPSPGYPGRVPPSRSLARRRRRSVKIPTPVRVGIWLLVGGFGIATIGGTLLQVLPNRAANDAVDTEQVEAAIPEPTPKSFPVALNQEIPALKSELQELPNLYPGLTPKIFYADVDTGRYASVEGTEAIAAASTIKLPILLAFFEEVDAGRIDINQTMAIQATQIADGSGDLQISPPGTQFTALEVATQMIINSDNTATNMMIDLLGGNEALNKWFRLQGLEKTQLNNPLPDIEGTNKTSARDLAHTMLAISEGEELSQRSRDRILNILKRTYNKDLLAANLENQGALTYNKTGYIRSILADVVLVDMPNGKRYVISALVQRPDNDGRALELLRRISSLTYKEADKAIKPAVTPLGNPEELSDPEAATSESASPSEEPAATDSLEADPPEANPPETNLPEEEPYPSANPRD